MNTALRLLLVEDDPVSGAFLTAALEALPAIVDLATDAAQARRLARVQIHALWLIDANLPDGSGERLLADLRAGLHADAPSVPSALALTADPFPERHASLRAAGFAKVLTKPLDGETLRTAVLAQLAGDTSAPPRPDGGPWDEARALAAAGGRIETVLALRQLFLTELPRQRSAIRQALAAGDATTAQATLHQLKAACAFVGATRLLDAVRALHATPADDVARAAFERECDALI
ncbi:Hpt domain-containing response regulator [Rehaibacterium terrae]|jgi:DNA-binding response OmpR family regulator|uniref:DNA-binding response OmpR family regulator n=1 Tax=Rehaibacterium terrae TaxID=1341696 RepID=A0A7W7V709_9GAMM|nr:response regulator [Rehaibacterium terrae]MBB5014366.1 DNA-binding response OmpR family regulator [Rehaibacterium terrae]